MDNYYSDYRVRRADNDSYFKNIDEKLMQATIHLWDDEILNVKIRYVVCDVCEGKGKHVNPSIDYNGLTAEDFDSDPDFREDYFSGQYDVTCYCCGGKRVILLIDRENTPREIIERIDEFNRERDEFRRIQDAERRMGA